MPDTPRISPLVPGTQALAQSMLLLEESIDSGAVLGQFEQLYRRNSNMVNIWFPKGHCLIPVIMFFFVISGHDFVSFTRKYY